MIFGTSPLGVLQAEAKPLDLPEGDKAYLAVTFAVKVNAASENWSENRRLNLKLILIEEKERGATCTVLQRVDCVDLEDIAKSPAPSALESLINDLRIAGCSVYSRGSSFLGKHGVSFAEIRITSRKPLNFVIRDIVEVNGSIDEMSRLNDLLGGLK